MKEELLIAISELRTDFNEMHTNIEWEEFEELYPQASQIFRNIEHIEYLIKRL